MTINLELSPETEARLIARATMQGLSVEDWLRNTIEGLLDCSEELSTPTNTLSPSERAEKFVNWTKSHLSKVPPLPDEAISRESIYREREDSQR